MMLRQKMVENSIVCIINYEYWRICSTEATLWGVSKYTNAIIWSYTNAVSPSFPPQVIRDFDQIPVICSTRYENINYAPLKENHGFLQLRQQLGFTPALYQSSMFTARVTPSTAR